MFSDIDTPVKIKHHLLTTCNNQFKCFFFINHAQVSAHGLLAQADRYMAKEPCIPLIVSAQLCLEPLQVENQPIPVQVLVQCEPAVSNEFIFMRCIQNYNL